MKGWRIAAARLLPILFLGGPPHLLRVAGLLFRMRGRRRSLEERLADFPRGDLPLASCVRVRFDGHQIPFVEGDSDLDVACALGMVHAHLRLGQMEITRRIARGRLSELFGPFAVKFDHSLRSLGLDRALPAMLASLPGDTRAWLTAFVAGINQYQQRMLRPPPEFVILRIPRQAWTLEDVLMVSRLAGSDVNWVLWWDLLGLRRVHAWRVVWGKILDLGLASPPSFTPEGWEAYLPRLLGKVIRSGSNSFAAAAGPGRAILASDPHLSVMVPNVWMLAGYRSPSYQVVGLMLPGLPFVALGRNPRVAWGGTNMYAASSDLVDVGGLPPGDFTARREVIRVRGWPDREITLRSTAFGPVVSDAPFLARYQGPPLSLRWMGHLPSDEISAFLAANRAGNWEQFRRAFSTYAVSGQNLVYADADGNVGQLMAVRLPKRETGVPHDLLVQPGDARRSWETLLGPEALPSWLNPPGKRVVSANNRPAFPGFPVGYLFPPGDRHRRIMALLEDGRTATLEGFQAAQADVHSAACLRFRDLLAARMQTPETGANRRGMGRMLRCLAAWDGNYRAASRGAAAFQLIMHAFAVPYLESCYGKTLTGYLLGSEAFLGVLEEELGREPGPAMLEALRLGALRAHALWRRYPAWGILHRMRPSHPLRMLPGLGRLFVFDDVGAAGSSQTVMKTAHPVTGGPHAVTYGAIARHVSDLSHPDENHFALLGGQDGWLLSANSLDLWGKWKRGEYVRLPLEPDSVRAAFPHLLELRPGGAPPPPADGDSPPDSSGQGAFQESPGMPG